MSECQQLQADISSVTTKKAALEEIVQSLNSQVRHSAASRIWKWGAPAAPFISVRGEWGGGGGGGGGGGAFVKCSVLN